MWVKGKLSLEEKNIILGLKSCFKNIFQIQCPPNQSTITKHMRSQDNMNKNKYKPCIIVETPRSGRTSQTQTAKHFTMIMMFREIKARLKFSKKF